MVSGFDRHRHESFFRRPSKKESAGRPNYSELIAQEGMSYKLDFTKEEGTALRLFAQ